MSHPLTPFSRPVDGTAVRGAARPRRLLFLPGRYRFCAKVILRGGVVTPFPSLWRTGLCLTLLKVPVLRTITS